MDNNSKQPAAFVLDCDQKSALAIVRSLGSRGVRVVALSTRPTAVALRSKFVSERHIHPSPVDDPENFLISIIRLAESEPVRPILFYCSDVSALLVSRNRTRLEKVFQLLLPSEENFEIAFDKMRTMELAARLDIPTPETLFANREIDFPVVIKPRHNIVWKGEVGTRLSVTLVSDSREFEKVMGKISYATDEVPILQRLVCGEEYGIEVLARAGVVQTLVAHRRIRSISPRGGASVVKETIDPPEKLVGYTRALLASLSWEGPAMVEFKYDGKRKEYVLMEINGRFWGSLPLAVFAGVDFPYLYYLSAQGLPLVNVSSAKEGVRSTYLLGDIKNILSVLFAKDAFRKILYPSRFVAIINFLSPKSLFAKSDVWRWGDPAPFFYELVDRMSGTKK